MNCQKILTINFLPEEILQKIIFLLPIKDLKNATSVCRRWLSIGEQKLTKCSRLCINHKNVGMMKKLLTSQRMKTMKSVRFLSWFLPVKESEAVILEIYKNVDIDELIVRGNGLLIADFREDQYPKYKSVDPILLASCMNRMKKVSMSKTLLTVEQVETMFKEMSKDTDIMELEISDNMLFDGEPNMLAVWVEKMRQLISMKKTKKHQREKLDKMLMSMLPSGQDDED